MGDMTQPSIIGKSGFSAENLKQAVVFRTREIYRVRRRRVSGEAAEAGNSPMVSYGAG